MWNNLDDSNVDVNVLSERVINKKTGQGKGKGVGSGKGKEEKSDDDDEMEVDDDEEEEEQEEFLGGNKSKKRGGKQQPKGKGNKGKKIKKNQIVY